MKKIFYIFLFSFIFIISSCTSLSELFSGKSDSDKIESPATSDMNENNSDNSINSNNISNEIEEISDSPVIDLSSDNTNVTLKDLINTIPQEFEEPLVRDLEPPVLEENKIVNVTESDTNDDVQNILSVNDATDTKTETVSDENNFGNIQNTTVNPSSETKVSSVKPETTIVPATNSVKNETTSSVKNETKTPVTNTEHREKSVSVPENKTESKTENIISKTDEKPVNVSSNESSPVQKVEPVTERKTEPENNKIVQKQENLIKPETQKENITKTLEPPVTSAGTKTENKTPVIPSKPENKTVQPATNTNNKPEEKNEIIDEDFMKQNQGLLPVEQTQNENNVLTPSRSVVLNKGETLIVEYPGSGWLYLGSDHEYNNLESKGRKAGNNKTTYILTALEPGTQIQHFYKTDSVSGNYIDDYIEVTVRDKKGSPSTEVYAPSYEEIVPKKPEKPAISSTKIAQPEITIPAEASKIEVNEVLKTGERSSIEYTPEDPEYKEDVYTEKYEAPVTKQTEPENTKSLLEQAQALYEEKRFNDALNTINTFLDYAINYRDSGLYLKGQILEADSSIKNIKGAISAYNELINNYPASEHWDDANKRIIYLKRFYIEAR